MEPTFKRVQGLRTALETIYGARPSLADTDAIFFKTASVKPTFETVDLTTDQPFMGAAKKIPVGSRFDVNVELYLQSSGTQGVAPPLGEYLVAGGHAETVVAAGSGGLTQTSPATKVGVATGTFTYTKTAAPVVTLPRTVTLVCTTGGGSGVAAFTVSAPAVGAHTAYSATAQVMTDAAPFALCNACTVTPTVGTAFVAGDTYTLKLMPPHVYYTPVSGDFGSNAGLMYFDGRHHDFSGARYNVEMAVTKKELPTLKATGMGLYGGIVEQLAAPDVTLTRWKTPVGVNSENTTAPTLHGVLAPMSEFSFNAGCKVFDNDLPGQHEIMLTDRMADSCSITIQSPPFATWDYHESVRKVLGGGLSWQHGITPGYICAFESAVAYVSEPDIVDVNGVNFVKFKVSLVPDGATANAEYKILFY